MRSAIADRVELDRAEASTSLAWSVSFAEGSAIRTLASVSRSWRMCRLHAGAAAGRSAPGPPGSVWVENRPADAVWAGVDVGRRCLSTRTHWIGLRPVAHDRRARSLCGATGGPSLGMGAGCRTVDARHRQRRLRTGSSRGRRVVPRRSLRSSIFSEQTPPRLGADPPPHEQVTQA
jgi:hypothetical protein